MYFPCVNFLKFLLPLLSFFSLRQTVGQPSLPPGALLSTQSPLKAESITGMKPHVFLCDSNHVLATESKAPEGWQLLCCCQEQSTSQQKHLPGHQPWTVGCSCGKGQQPSQPILPSVSSPRPAGKHGSLSAQRQVSKSRGPFQPHPFSAPLFCYMFGTCPIISVLHYFL